jgi:CRISPR-associated endonuclease Csy4
MNYYLDITLLSDTEISLYFLWRKVYEQVHLALVEHKQVDNKGLVAAAFPQYNGNRPYLGNKLRLLAKEKMHLEQISIQKCLARLSDYVHITSIKTVPTSITQYAYFRRKQIKNNIKRLARRREKYLNEDYEQALAHLGDRKVVYSDAPFIYLRSATNQQIFPLIIVRELSDTPSDQQFFSSYGLSQNSTVPLF